ncbi:phage tail protein [uncultured Phascolarctobacterium sp.]|uniref:phage tail protein n=1 Tax=uncultured Phascolarctobacterium sp. TaxID=512296 RepID=UPI0025CC6B63|nr:phage tail protein [uncultured Phascolarctobacterium sp.]
MISIDAKEIEKAKLLLHNYPKQVTAAAASAINRTSTAVKTQVSKTIRENYLISAKDIKGTLSIKRASSLKLTGMISSIGAAPLITAFRVRTYKKGPVRVQVLKNSSPKAVPGLFIGTSLKGYVGAMQRKNLSMRYPLRIPRGPSVPQMFAAKRSMSTIAPFAEKTLNQRFLHEVQYRLGKYGGQ